MTYTAGNSFGEVVTCSFDINVLPSLNFNCPDDITLTEARASGCKAFANWEEPVAACGVTLTSSHASGSGFLVGITEVTYTASDDFGNSNTCSFNVIVENDLSLTVDDLIEPTCYDSLGGSIDVDAIGGVPPYRYNWPSNGNEGFNDTDKLTNAGAGVHIVEVMDNVGCVVADTVILGQPAPLLMTANVFDLRTGKFIDLEVTGSTPPYQYQWDGRGILDIVNEQDVTVVKNGSYTVVVTDANGCTNLLEVLIDSLPIWCESLDFDISPNPNNGYFILDFKSCANDVLIEIYDIQGKKITENHSVGISNRYELPGLSSAVYIIKVTERHKSEYKRLIVK